MTETRSEEDRYKERGREKTTEKDRECKGKREIGLETDKDR
jgi:hypothetical protein